ncbi:MAG: LPS assembly lipoprotein LptE [Candidatus Omnitrophota bacterium]
MRSIKNNLLNLCLVSCVLCPVLSGCGYTTSVVTRGNIQTIQVDIFKNKIDITKEVSAKDKYEIYVPDLEIDVRDAITERIFLDGHLKLAKKDSADSVLEGEIIEYRRDPLRYQDEDVIEYRISIACKIVLKKTKDSEVLLEEENIVGDSTYFITGSLAKSETEALKDATKDLARRIVNRIVENW